MSARICKDASEAWRDHVLKQVVNYLETHREAIDDGFAMGFQVIHHLLQHMVAPGFAGVFADSSRHGGLGSF